MQNLVKLFKAGRTSYDAAADNKKDVATNGKLDT